MISYPLLLTLGLMLLLPPAAADTGDAYTIRPADLPPDAPRFDDYPAQPYHGPNATPDVRSHKRSRTYRTQLRNWASEKANFAGHYIVATWGCGTSCTQVALIDARTGKVHHPAGIRTNSIVDVHGDLLDTEGPLSPRRADFGAMRYRADSRLLVVIGMPEGRAASRGISYFTWDNERLTRLRLVPRPPAPSP